MSSKQATPARTTRAARKPRPTDAKRPRRVREPGERNQQVYRRYDDRFEVGYRDSTGKLRWAGPFDLITEARGFRDTVNGDKAKGKHVQPNPRLTFGNALDRWLAEQVVELSENTRDIYTSHAENHLRPRWDRRRLDTIDVDELASVIRELRAEGLAERTIGGIVAVANRVFKFAARRMSWHGTNPTMLLELGERPKTTTGKRRIYRADELTQTIAAAHGQWRTVFALTAVCGGRKSEVLGLIWSDLDLADRNDASVTFTHQINRKGQRVKLKTKDSQGTVVLPPQIAVALLEHRAESALDADNDFVFCTSTGRPLGQRNALRALRAAQKRARTPDGEPTFPVLQQPGPVPRGSVPTFHGFRHTAASYAIADGDSAEEVSWMLRHKDSTITRQVYIHEIQTAERKAKARAKLEARFMPMLGHAVTTEQADD